MRTATRLAGLVVVLTLAAPCLAQSDYDLYMLRLVNRARQDPAGEAGRIGSTNYDPCSPKGPLAYIPLVAEAAENHNTWMHENIGNESVPLGDPSYPRSFSHYEVSGTPGFTGVRPSDRITATGYEWGIIGENILFRTDDEDMVRSTSLMEGNHRGWWDSPSHRDSMLDARFYAFGHHWETREIPDEGTENLDPYTHVHFASQTYSAPRYEPKTHVIGLVYDDRDADGNWTPLDAGDPDREGLSDVSVEVWTAGGLVASSQTLSPGAFAVAVGSGEYHLRLRDDSPSPAFDEYWLAGVTIVGLNVDVGDLEVDSMVNAPGDITIDGVVDVTDLAVLASRWQQPGVRIQGDLSGDGAVDVTDLAILAANWGNKGAAVPEPTALTLLAAGVAAVVRRRR
jgi:hypothetical protein